MGPKAQYPTLMKYKKRSKSKYKKYCARCGKEIDETRNKYCMTITKVGEKIIEVESFHFSCWKNFLKLNLKMLLSSK